MTRLLKQLLFIALLLGVTTFPAITRAAEPQLTPEMQRLIEQKVEEILAKRLQQMAADNPHPIEKPSISKGEQQQIVEQVVNSLSFSGTIEVEANYSKDYADDSSSDVTLATMEFGVDAQVHKWVRGHVLFLYEEDSDDDVVIDEAFITLGDNDKTPLYLSAGRMYIPFGNFTTFMISDPLTQEMAESQESAVQIGYEGDNLHAAVYAFNGDTNEGDSTSTIEQYGAHLGYSIENDNLTAQADVSYTSSLFDSDNLCDEFGAFATDGDYIPGLGLHIMTSFSGLTIIGEYITALDELDVAGDDIEPYTFNIEAAYTTAIGTHETTFAIAFQGSDDLAGFLPEERYLASIGFSLYDDTAISLEYAHDEDYSVRDGGTNESADSMTAQLAYEF